RPAVPHARLLNRDRPEAGGDSPLRQVTIADDLAVAVGVAAALVAVDPVGDLGGDGLGEEVLGALAGDVGKDVLDLGEWHDADIGGRKTHGGVLLCRVGTFGEPQYTKSTPPFFIPLSTTFDHTPGSGRLGRCEGGSNGQRAGQPVWGPPDP